MTCKKTPGLEEVLTQQKTFRGLKKNSELESQTDLL